MAAGNMVLGILFAGLGAAALALAMSVQRYAMITVPPVQFICFQVKHQSLVWFCGLVIYWIANGLFAVALIFAPLALLGAIFTTLLVWNLFFGKWLLNEEVTLIKSLGAAFIMIGVSLIGIATPADIPVEYSRSEAEVYLNSTRGSVYLGCLVTFVLICVVIIAIFEYFYPLDEMDKNLTFWEKIMMNNGLRYFKGEEEISLANLSKFADYGMASMSKDVPRPSLSDISLQIHVKLNLQNNVNTPRWLEKVMGIIYPLSLGMDEGIGHLAMKSFMALLATCGDNGECGSAILWGMIMGWLVSSLATLWWLRTVFKRYHVTQALPIEYGGVMACDALSAIIFYQEDTYMEPWQLSMTIAGVCCIIFGIIVGRAESTGVFLPLNSPSYDRFLFCCGSKASSK